MFDVPSRHSHSGSRCVCLPYYLTIPKLSIYVFINRLFLVFRHFTTKQYCHFLFYCLEFICDVTVGEGEEIPPNEEFRKTWRLRNIGAEAWPESCVLQYVRVLTLIWCYYINYFHFKLLVYFFF